MRYDRLGESAVILKDEALQDPLSVFTYGVERLRQHPIEGIEDALPCYDSLTVYYNPLKISYESMVEALTQVFSEEDKRCDLPERKRHQIPVCYDAACAPDLESVAAFSGLSVQDVISLHTEGEYRVAGIGFTPGFGFLSGLNHKLNCPRKDRPRKSVPVGAVGIAGRQTGVYPSASSGGWNLIGQTPVEMVNFSLADPLLLSVGDAVEFYEISYGEFTEWKK